MFRAEPDALRSYFDSSLCRGAVVRIEDYPFLNQPVRRRKFFVVLNKDCSNPEIYHFLMTSKVSRYRSFSFSNYGVSIPRGTVDCLAADETIVDCFRLMPAFKRDYLLEQLCVKGITLHPPLPVAIMQEIDDNIRRSRSISPAIKSFILS